MGIFEEECISKKSVLVAEFCASSCLNFRKPNCLLLGQFHGRFRLIGENTSSSPEGRDPYSAQVR